MKKENGAAASESPTDTQALVVKKHMEFDDFTSALRANMPADASAADDDRDDDDELVDDDGGDGDTASKRKPKSKKPKNLEAAAEALGIKVEDLYTLEIPSARQGEKPYTLGALKDLAATQDDFSVRSLTLDSDRRTFERERVTALGEIREIMGHLPADALKPEALQKLRAGIETKHARERGEIVKVIPEWRDEAVRVADLKAMVAHLGTYGMPETFLMEHFDHRTMRYVRDSMRIMQAVDKALGTVKERRGNNRGTGTARGEKRTGKSETNAGSDVRQTRQVRGFLDTIAAAAAKT